ncbi:MAG: ABC transporter ATP-binding protein, partial [Isosphaeraceae bacterium]
MIRVSELRVDFDEVCAVRGLSLEVGPGEVCGLIGPNGAGKTTTMRALLGLIEPTYGEIELAGVDIREHPQDAWRAVGFMPDFAPMYDDLKCWEFLDLFAASFFIPRPDRPPLVARYLDLVGLTEKRNALIAGLSRGMRQRLMLAKTLIPDPNVLMLDEPASGLDPQGRIDLKNIIKRLRSEGKTVLISSHVLAEMTEFCTSVAIMEHGRMVVNGTIKDVAARIMGGTILEIELLDGEEAFRRVIAADPHAGLIERQDDRFSIAYQGGPEQASDLLGTLVQN